MEIGLGFNGDRSAGEKDWPEIGTTSMQWKRTVTKSVVHGSSEARVYPLPRCLRTCVMGPPLINFWNGFPESAAVTWNQS